MPGIGPSVNHGAWWLKPGALRLWQALLAVQVLVVCGLAFSPSPPPSADTGWDKANHALAFAVLACTAELAFWSHHRRTLRNALGLLLLGACIEVVQTQIPERAGEWADLLADSTGIGLGLGLVALWQGLARRMSRP